LSLGTAPTKHSHHGHLTFEDRLIDGALNLQEAVVQAAVFFYTAKPWDWFVNKSHLQHYCSDTHLEQVLGQARSAEKGTLFRFWQGLCTSLLVMGQKNNCNTVVPI